jgi:hypothetical protein
MSEYEDRYPDAYGRREETDREPRQRHFLGLGLPRQVRDSAPVVTSTPREESSIPNGPAIPGEPSIKVVDIADLPPPPPRHAAQLHTERPRQPLVERSAREISEDVAEQLAASPFIDSSGISITVDDSGVTLEGTINSLIAISLARALALNVPGVSRVQVQLRVHQTPKSYAAG